MPPKKVTTGSKSKTTTPAKPAPKKAAAAKDGAAAKKQPAGKVSAEKPEVILPGVTITLREVNAVLIKDDGNAIKDSGRWPLVIDPNDRVGTFLRYQNVNYINAVDPSEREPDRIRQALIGAIRFGKPFVFDMMTVDLYDASVVTFDEIQPGLMNIIMDKSILQEERYMKLVKESDGDEYDRYKFNDSFMDNFKFIIITQSDPPPKSLMTKMYPVRVDMS